MSEASEVMYRADDGEVNAYLAIPSIAPRGPLAGILLIHDLNGLTDHIRGVAREFASKGYIALAPDLNTEEWKPGLELANSNKTSKDLISAVEYLRKRLDVDPSCIGCVGFGFGGTLSILLASISQHIRACIPFDANYPPVDKIPTNIRATFHSIHSGKDKEGVDDLQRFSKGLFEARIDAGGGYNVYDKTELGFFDESSPSYSEEHATYVWKAMLLFFDQELRADKSHLSPDQAGFFFHRVSTANKEYFISRINQDGEFARKFGGSVLHDFERLLDEDSERILQLAGTNAALGEGLGRGAGANLSRLPKRTKEIILDLAKRNPAIERGLIERGGSNFSTLSADDRSIIQNIARKNTSNVETFGRGAGFVFADLSDEDRRFFLEYAQNDNSFARGLGEFLGGSFAVLSKDERQVISKLVRANPEFLRGLESEWDVIHPKVVQEQRQRLEFFLSRPSPQGKRIGGSFGIGYARLNDEEKELFLNFAKTNPDLAEGIGMGLKLVYSKLSGEEKREVDGFLQNNQSVATAFQSG